MEGDFKIEVVNDIAVIMRIQGRLFESAAIYEPETTGLMSITEQRIGSHLQSRGAALLGRMLANSALQVVDSELGRRLQRDKWLVAVMAAFSRNLNPKQNAREAKAPEVGLVPMENSVRSLVRRAVADVDSYMRGA
jgi:hypothetical protein